MLTNEVLRIIKQRRSIRSFRDEQIEEEELQADTGSGTVCSQRRGSGVAFHGSPKQGAAEQAEPCR